MSESERPVFRGFDEYAEVERYRRNLPHWRQQGATYFVTFRLADSIPRAVAEGWIADRCRWLRAHGIDPAMESSDPAQFHALMAKVPIAERRAFEREQAHRLHVELDRCHGSCVLRRLESAQIVTEALRFFHGTRIWLGDFVVMPNHAHALVQPRDEFELEDVLGSIKKFSARRIGAVGERLWQAENYDRLVRDAKELGVWRRYIAANPSEANLREGEFIHEAAPWLDEWAST